MTMEMYLLINSISTKEHNTNPGMLVYHAECGFGGYLGNLPNGIEYHCEKHSLVVHEAQLLLEHELSFPEILQKRPENLLVFQKHRTRI
jgi:hypothetical protein